MALDDSKRKIMAGILRAGAGQPVLRALPKDPHYIRHLFERLKQEGPVVACYEAGVSAYDLHRQISALAVPCHMMAPALTPRRPGQRITTDRRDAGKLVHLFRSGELSPIHVPAEAGDAVRDLVRCRDDVRRDVLRWRDRPLKLLADHGLRNRSHFLRLAELAKEVFDDAECQCGTGHDKAPRGAAHQSLRPNSYRRAKPRHWRPAIGRIAEGQIDDDRAHNNGDSPFG